MPRSHRFFPPTKTDRERANITLLTSVWLALTLIGVAAVARTTSSINERAVAQTNADSVALVAADRGVDAARHFSRRASINVVAIEVVDNMVTVAVREGSTVAQSSAVKPK